jgi:hypothetical protein
MRLKALLLADPAGSLSTIDLGDMATATATATGLSLSTPSQLIDVMRKLLSTMAPLLSP